MKKWVEELSEIIHKEYCKQYEIKEGKPYWTKGDYSELNEETKEYDRVMARLFISILTKKLERLEEFAKIKKEQLSKDIADVPEEDRVIEDTYFNALHNMIIVIDEFINKIQEFKEEK